MPAGSRNRRINRPKLWAEALARAASEQLATKSDIVQLGTEAVELRAELRTELTNLRSEFRSELTVMKWMLGFLLALNAGILLKLFA